MCETLSPPPSLTNTLARNQQLKSTLCISLLYQQKYQIPISDRTSI